MRKYPPSTIHKYLDLPSTQILQTHISHGHNTTPSLKTLVQTPYPLLTHTTVTQTHVPVLTGSVKPNSLLSSTYPLSTPSQARTHLTHNTALDTIPEPCVPPTYPALTTSTLHPSPHQHFRHHRTITLSQHTHMQQYTHHSHNNRTHNKANTTVSQTDQ